MKSLKFLFCSFIMVAGVACSGSKNAAPAASNNHDEIRQRANSGYAELDGKPAPKAAPAAAKATTAETAPAAAPVAEAPATRVQDVDEDQAAITPNDLPKPVIMVMPAPSGKGASVQEVVASNPNARAAMEGVMEYLTKKGYEVKSLEGGAELDNIVQMQNDIAGTDEDLAYLASLSLNADVYIKFSGSLNDEGQVNVDLSAYESSTARQLGSQSSFVNSHGRNSQIDMKANLKTAARKAMGGLEKTIQSYWIDDMKNGVQYKVIMNVKGEYTDSQLEDLQEDIVSNMKKIFNKVKVNSITPQTVDVTVYANAEKTEDSQAVYSEIRASLKSFAETKKINLAKKLIIMDVK